MPTAVPATPPDHYFNSDTVGQVVFGREVVGPWVDSANFLVGRNLSPFISNTVPMLAGATAILSGTMYIQYQKSPGAQYVGFEFELYNPIGAAAEKTVTLDLGLPPGAVYTQLSSSCNTTIPQQFRQFSLYPVTSSARQTVREFVDVSSCVSTSILVFTASWTTITGSSEAAYAHGFRTVTGWEVPRFQLLNFTPDPGIEETWARSGQDMADSVVDTSASPKKRYGFQEIARAMDVARKEVRNQMNLASLLDPGNNWVFKKEYDGGTDGYLTYGAGISSVSSIRRIFYLRAKNIYGTAVTTDIPYKMSVIYSSVIGAKYTFTLNYRPYGTVSWSSTSISPSAGANKASSSTTFNFSTSGGADQIIECYFSAAVDDPAGTLYIHDVWLGENNT